MKRVYIREKEGKIELVDALSQEIISTFDSVSEAVGYAVKNHYQLPVQAFNGEFVKDKEGNYIYHGEKHDFEYADGTLLEDAKLCPKCGWVAFWEEICDEDKNTRECYVCPKCGYVIECTPPPEETPAVD
ncbi:hypothetical protein [Hydrogenivirga sp. 128-5-R1-1]|uniref:hypothetical protein n=1 Tax=Hydrogenivirga sp. 128-5-R1-1 TaxID=392423 RepID=UPI00015F32AA|nr:hypothetical protein [Hydrogenivirga sp. 128-5-R1-1]EDP73238.1 hypothetical protein HG1285_11697 [Hydrogenivirga sp. 128-5-R1-1]